MASIVAVCNMALSRLGTRARIADPREDSVEAQHCAIWFDPARDAALRAHDWNFARRYLRLAARADVTPPTGWALAYSYPGDCLRLRGILPEQAPPSAFQVASALDGAGNAVRVILANVAAAEAWYTARIVDAELWDAGFVRAMAAMLAAHVALPITQKESIAQAMALRAQLELAQAMADDANEGVNLAHRLAPATLAVRGIDTGEGAA
jgi:hypothetical protein